MATTTATLALSNDIGSSTASISASFELNKAGSVEGMDAFQSKRLVTKSTDQVDLVEYTAATVAGVASTHNFIYINNASTDSTEFITVTQGAAGAGSPTIVEEIGRLYGGDWMFIPWSAAAAANDICVKPSVATEMPIEYILFS
tara:strand:+ start:347 stop:778 length:432 start_codon:yes stop_codon:yes gene_type:complete